ncbi:hypothetical protein L1987_42573 [Smallanthus sonchifolius]|uniref:Uncharacterized protein n=1 Tax=Smallanthus sonchifolius TaxID=185202 RepID=A0ACB9GIQ8_9ASTR|nr:hypothetical protein L1987_42573 [Smallanthus sonchifolius]
MDNVIGGKFKLGRKIGIGSFRGFYPGVNLQSKVLDLCSHNLKKEHIALCDEFKSKTAIHSLDALMANVSPFQPPNYSQGMHGYAYQSVGEVSPRPTEKEATILLIHHLPETIPHDTSSRLFSHCFLCLSMHYWKDEELSRFLGKVLSVERATTPPHTRSQQNNPTARTDAMSSSDDATAAIDFKQESMMNSLPTLESIAEKLGVGGPYTQAAFAFRGKEPEDEVHIYTWMDATPCELTDLVAPEARRRDALLSFAFVYPTKTSHFTVKELWHEIFNFDQN